VLPPETARRLDKRVLRRGAAASRRRPLRYLGVDERSISARASSSSRWSGTEEPIWAGVDRTRKTLDRFFTEALPWRGRRSIRLPIKWLARPCAGSGPPTFLKLRGLLVRYLAGQCETPRIEAAIQGRVESGSS
jgi:hypothetical protein